jgi:hypothetical protein
LATALSGDVGESRMKCISGTEMALRFRIELEIEEVAVGFVAILLRT